MNLLIHIQTALRGIVTNKLRAALTMLGVAIGVGAVIAMISVGSGATSSVTSRIQSLGTNLLTVSPGAAGGLFGGARQAAGTARSLTLEDAEAIKREIPGIAAVSPEAAGNAQVVFKDSNVNTRIYGVTPVYENVHNFHVEFGDFIRDQDLRSLSRVAVLGKQVVADLFGSGESPIGQTIKINNIPFRVVGIMETKGQSGFANLDDMIFVPLSTAQKRIFGDMALSSISIQVASDNQMDTVSSLVTSLLLVRHRISDPNNADFRVMNQAELLSTMSSVSQTFTLFLGGIAAVSLLVGGIGIMNIMLVSVTERTREIGLRKAVGARQSDILWQFLIESLTLSLAGGAIGMLIGVAGAYAMSVVGSWPFVLSPNSVVLAFVFSSLVGVFFGLYPAWRASLLSPIEALRYE